MSIKTAQFFFNHVGNSQAFRSFVKLLNRMKTKCIFLIINHNISQNVNLRTAPLGRVRGANGKPGEI